MKTKTEIETTESKKLMSLNDINGSEENPFMKELEGKMYLQPRADTIIAQGEEIINKYTGELSEKGVLIGKRKIVDKSQFAKIYASEIMELFDLSKAALNVLLYLGKIMDYENKAMLSYQKQYSKLGYKTMDSVLKGLRELITNGIIYPHTINGIWWVNPIYICKGERFAKYTEYIIGTEEQIKGQTEAKLKKQNKKQLELLDINTNGKLTKALNSKSIDKQGNLQFPDTNPYENK